MSAYIVDRAHIDALVTAGLYLPRPYGPLRWDDPNIDPDPSEWMAGDAWGARGTRDERERELTDESADRVGAMLWATNVRSVAHRYTDCQEHLDGGDVTTWPGRVDFDPIVDVAGYTFARLGHDVAPAIVLGAIQGYEYQSCEHPGWRKSEAAAYCTALYRTAAHKLADERGWSITDENRDVFGKVLRRIG